MKKSISLLVLLALLLSSCKDVQIYKYPDADVETRARDLLRRMTVQEKIAQVNQLFTGNNDNANNTTQNDMESIPADIGSYIYFQDNPRLANEIQKRAVEQTRLGIPILFGYDVIHGYRTIFPIPLAQACSWNPDLVREASAVAAREASAAGIRWTFSPMIDIARDPRWGRVMEGYGEDPYTTSRFCEAAVKGYQGDDLSSPHSLAACMKHYVAYGASEAGRDYVPTEVPMQVLWDTYLPPYEAGVKAGAMTAMSSFNTLNGIPASAYKYTLTDILKDTFGMEGFVVSDWDAVGQLILQGYCENRSEAAKAAINAGVDMDMISWAFGGHLEELIENGEVDMKRLDDAVLRILKVKFALGLFEHPYVEDVPDSERYLLPEYKDLAQKLSEESIVLLKNENSILPLSTETKLAVVGPFADSPRDMNANWSGQGREKDVCTIIQGLKEDFRSIVSANASDVVICCIGQNAGESGENCSRSTIDMDPSQEALVKKMHDMGKKVVVVLTNGRPLNLIGIEPYADAIVESWHLGTMAGNAISAVLCGKANPSGKLAVTFPRSTGQIPIHYNRRQSARRYDMGNYQDISVEPLYEFGYGLSYSDFEYGEIEISSDTLSMDGCLKASVTVTNRSMVDGYETALWFIQDPFCSIVRPVKELRYFQKLLIPKGENRTFEFEISPSRDLSFVDEQGQKFVEAGEFRVMIGGRVRSFILVND